MEKVIQAEKTRLYQRKLKIDELTANSVSRFVELRRIVWGDPIPPIPRYMFDLEGEDYLAWVNHSKTGYAAKTGRSQDAKQWVSSNKARKYAMHLFPNMLESMTQYAHKVAHLLEPRDEIKRQFVDRYLTLDFALGFLNATVGGGKGAGSRPLLCDHSLQKKSSVLLTKLYDEIPNALPRPTEWTMRKSYINQHLRIKADENLAKYVLLRGNCIPGHFNGSSPNRQSSSSSSSIISSMTTKHSMNSSNHFVNAPPPSTSLTRVMSVDSMNGVKSENDSSSSSGGDYDDNEWRLRMAEKDEMLVRAQTRLERERHRHRYDTESFEAEKMQRIKELERMQKENLSLQNRIAVLENQINYMSLNQSRAYVPAVTPSFHVPAPPMVHAAPPQSSMAMSSMPHVSPGHGSGQMVSHDWSVASLPPQNQLDSPSHSAMQLSTPHYNGDGHHFKFEMNDSAMETGNGPMQGEWY